MRTRIVKAQLNNRTVYIPQWKPAFLVQVMQWDFKWRWFYSTPVCDADIRKFYTTKLSVAVEYIEREIYKDPFADMVVWQDGKNIDAEEG